MNEKVELAKKALNLSNEEWEGIGEPAREAILRLTDSVKLQDPDDSKVKENRSKLAQGIREVLALHPDQYAALPEYQREIILKKTDGL